MLLNSEWVKNEIKEEIKKFLESNENELRRGMLEGQGLQTGGGIKGENSENCNGIINKIYFKKIFLIYLGVPMLGAYVFIMLMSMDYSLEYYEVSFLVSLYGPSFEVYFV